jgi:hypothetical protein
MPARRYVIDALLLLLVTLMARHCYAYGEGQTGVTCLVLQLTVDCPYLPHGGSRLLLEPVLHLEIVVR